VEGFLIFISYRRGDSAGYAGRLHESLERRLGEGQVFRDVDGLEPGQDFVDAIAARLRDCRACLVLIGREWVQAADHQGRRRLDEPNDFVRIEIEAALARSDLLVIPVLVEGVSMPSPEDLPRTIRALSRRHAISLRDETWDTDFDRLVATLDKKVGRGLPLPSRRMMLWTGAAIVIVAAMLLIPRHATSPDTKIPEASNAATIPPRRTIALPRLAEAVHGGLIYTPLAGDFSSDGKRGTLRLRIRLSNEGGYPANFWDDSFRLTVQGQVLAPVGGLNEIVEGHAMRQGVVTFAVPPDADRAMLQIAGRGPEAAIPLDITNAGGTSSVDIADSGDALSRAQVFRIVREPITLVARKSINYDLVSMTGRRFVNAIRIIATIRAQNRGRYPWAFGSDALRVLSDGQLLAPYESPNIAIDGLSSGVGDFIFDLPPSARRIVLQVPSVPGAAMPFDLPAAP
jgi:hypothetical protein